MIYEYILFYLFIVFFVQKNLIQFCKTDMLVSNFHVHVLNLYIYITVQLYLP